MKFAVNTCLTILFGSLLHASVRVDGLKRSDNRRNILERGTKKTKKNAKSESMALVALIEKMPGYPGDFNPFGTATLRFDQDGGFLLSLHVDLVDPACMDCKVDIRSGMSCNEVSDSYWDGSDGSLSPWDDVGFYSFSDGFTRNAFKVDNGFGFERNKGHAIVLQDSDGTMSGCGIITSEVSSKVQTANMGMYPGYDGSLSPSGEVTVTYNYDDTFNLHFNVEGLEANCVGCGIHIHAGTSCATHAEVKGHGWNTELVEDMWTPKGGSVYRTNSRGKAEGSFNLFNGYGYEENISHAVVMHGQDGTRLACGILK